MSKPLVVVDYARREIFVRGREVYFPPIEYAIVTALIKSNAAMTRSELSEQSGCCDGTSSSRTVDQHIARARRRLGKDRDLIATIPTHGYRWEGSKKA